MVNQKMINGFERSFSLVMCPTTYNFIVHISIAVNGFGHFNINKPYYCYVRFSHVLYFILLYTISGNLQIIFNPTSLPLVTITYNLNTTGTITHKIKSFMLCSGAKKPTPYKLVITVNKQHIHTNSLYTVHFKRCTILDRLQQN